MLMVIILMFFHFFTDYFANYALLTLGLDYEGIAWIFLMYNILAFLPQPLLGFLIDKTSPKHFVSIAMAILAMGVLFMHVFVWAGVVFLGLGNALFHVAGGKMIIHMSEKKGPLGAFVAPGAIGLACAWMFIGNDRLALILSIVAVLVLLAYQFVKAPVIERSDKYEPIRVHWLIVVAFAILIRAFLGKYVTYEIPWVYWVLLAGCSAGLGKFTGGFIADRFGVTLTVMISTLLGVVSLFFLDNPVVSLIGIFSINIAMPITLHLAVRAMPRYTATAFGITAMSLVPGFYAGVFLAGHYYLLVTLFLMLANVSIIVWANHRLKKAKEVDLWK